MKVCRMSGGTTDRFHDENVERVAERLSERSRVGLRKYGRDTQRADFDAVRWLRELQDEPLDAVVYIEASLSAMAREKTDRRSGAAES